MKKLLLAITVVAVALALCACSDDEPSEQIANPWQDCATLEDASKIAGFDIAVPDRIDGYPNVLIQAIEKDMIQVIYSDKELEDETSSAITIRKATDDDDITGDYNDYEEESEVTMHGVEVDLEGKDGKVYTAEWEQGGYGYCILSDQGMDRDTVEQLVELIQ